MVLLKNDVDRGLPFTPGKRLVVVGTDVENIAATMGNYNGNNICPPHADSAFRRSVDTSCLDSYWDALNRTNTAAGACTLPLSWDLLWFNFSFTNDCRHAF